MEKKKCRTCGVKRLLSSFYAHPRMFDGHLNICKGCTKERVRKHREANIEKIREYDRGRGRRDYNWHERNPFKSKVQRKVREAVRTGKLIKPKLCEDCNQPGQGNRLEGHHEDYRKALEVVWLCSICHRARHKKK